MTQQSQNASVFDKKTPLPDDSLTRRAGALIGFDRRYALVHNRLRLLLRRDELPQWSQRHYKTVVPLCGLIEDQYPIVVFHGDVGTGKTEMAEAIANRLVAEAGAAAEDSILFKLSNRVRGSGKVGEMGTLLAEAFREVTQSAGRSRHAILIIDEGDSLAANRSQEQSHHEDKVAVNTLIQNIDDLRRHHGRVVVFLCTNRFSVLDAALLRRAAIVEKFSRPSESERRELFEQDLAGLGFTEKDICTLTLATGEREGSPPYTYSDIRTRLYPAALSRAFPETQVTPRHFAEAAQEMVASPVVKDA